MKTELSYESNTCRIVTELKQIFTTEIFCLIYPTINETHKNKSTHAITVIFILYVRESPLRNRCFEPPFYISRLLKRIYYPDFFKIWHIYSHE